MVRFVTSADDARKAVEEGFTAVECAFGREVIVNDEKEPFDHHNQYSSLQSAATQALRSSLKTDKVVVNHIDADNVLAAAILLGIVSRSNEWIKKMVPLVEIADTMGVHAVPESKKNSPEYKMLTYFNRNIERRTQNKENFEKALDLIKDIVRKGPTEEIEKVTENEKERVEKAKKEIIEKKGNVLLVRSDGWNFDVWYKEAPVVIAYINPKKAITIGVIDVATAEKLFGKGGLKNIYPKLGLGWGGREIIGGSPRDAKMDFSDAKKVFDMISKEAVTKDASLYKYNFGITPESIKKAEKLKPAILTYLKKKLDANKYDIYASLGGEYIPICLALHDLVRDRKIFEYSDCKYSLFKEKIASIVSELGYISAKIEFVDPRIASAIDNIAGKIREVIPLR